MNNMMNAAIKVTFRLLWLVVLLLLSAVTGQLHAQLFRLQDREYRLVEGKWHSFHKGEKGDQVVPDRLIVRLKDRGDLRRFDFSRAGIQNVEVVSEELFGGFYVIKVKPPYDPFTIASSLSKNALFDYVEFDAIGEFHATPNDPLYGNQWNLPKISMPSAWDIATGSNSVILAIIDTGTDYNHEDLDGNIWVNPAEDRNGNGRPNFYPYSQGGDLDGIDNDGNGYVDDLVGWDFYIGDNNPWPDFDPGVDGHGTAVAGIAAAETNNYESGNYRGVAGVAGGWGSTSGVKLMILRYYYYSNGPYASTTAQSVRYAARNGAKVINISSGWADHWAVLQNAIDSAANVYGCVLVASAGNNGGTGSSNDSIRYPARYSTTIAVGATVQDDSRWVTSGSNGSAIGPELDVMAPGGASIIWTTDMTGSAGYNSSGDYMSNFGGTSASAPHVAGLAALIRSVNPSLTWQQVRETIRLSTDKVSGMGGSNFTNQYGHGRINANRAVRNLYVPEVYSTLASALSSAVSGQTVVVSGTQTVSSYLLVNSGITLQLNAGSTLLFGPSSRLAVLGNLLSNGTSASHVTVDGQGYSRSGLIYAPVVVAGAGTANLQYTDFKNAAYEFTLWYTSGTVTVQNCSFTNFGYTSDAKALTVYSATGAISIAANTFTGSNRQGTSIYSYNSGTNVRIANNTIASCGTGIRSYSSDAMIRYNAITNNYYCGIQADNVSTAAEYRGNDIRSNGYGLFLNSASPWIMYNTIRSNGSNVIVNSSSPNFATHEWEGDQLRGHNTIAYAGAPLLRAQNSAFPYLGYGFDGGYNSIFETDLPHLWAESNSGIYADNNYWGSDNASYYADGTSWVLARTPLSSNPNPDPGSRIIFASDNQINALKKSFADTTFEAQFRDAISARYRRDYSTTK